MCRRRHRRITAVSGRARGAVTSDLYARGAATPRLVGGVRPRRGRRALRRLDGVAAAVFPTGPERAFYNNALLDRDLGPPSARRRWTRWRRPTRPPGSTRYAAWVHESDEGMRAELSGRGYTIDGDDARDGHVARRHLAPAARDRARAAGLGRVPARSSACRGLLSGADPSAFHILVARLDGESVATAMAFDHDGDCGVFNVTTLEDARRRGLGTALTARLSTTPRRVAARPRACSRPRWPSGSTRRSASATSAGSSSTCRRWRGGLGDPGLSSSIGDSRGRLGITSEAHRPRRGRRLPQVYPSHDGARVAHGVGSRDAGA